MNEASLKLEIPSKEARRNEKTGYRVLVSSKQRQFLRFLIAGPQHSRSIQRELRLSREATFELIGALKIAHFLITEQDMKDRRTRTCRRDEDGLSAFYAASEQRFLPEGTTLEQHLPLPASTSLSMQDEDGRAKEQSFFEALRWEVRRDILELLKTSPLGLAAMRKELRITYDHCLYHAGLRRHLNMLIEVGFITQEKDPEGEHVRYRRREDVIWDFFENTLRPLLINTTDRAG